jgi:hypothetical protein
MGLVGNDRGPDVVMVIWWVSLRCTHPTGTDTNYMKIKNGSSTKRVGRFLLKNGNKPLKSMSLIIGLR